MVSCPWRVAVLNQLSLTLSDFTLLVRFSYRERLNVPRVSSLNPQPPGSALAADKRSLGDILREFAQHRQVMQEELQKVIVGQHEVIEQLFAAIFTRGHCLLEGVPGLAKTLMVSTLARILDVNFKRVQFTPDLMPSDITGTNVLEEDEHGRRNFRFVEGPIFTNILLADEINRTPPKTQAALLQAMQEREVSVGQTTYCLPEPFFVIATQNPIEQEGTYPLPEAQQDRFMFKVFVKYPNFGEEFEIARRTTTVVEDHIVPVLSAEEIIALQRVVREVPITDHVIRYTLSLVRQTRVGEPGVPEFVSDQVSWGAGPRAVQFLILGGKARALLHGRTHVSTEDIQALAKPVLRHRLVVNFAAESEGVTVDDIVDRLIEITPTKEDELTRDVRFQKIFAS